MSHDIDADVYECDSHYIYSYMYSIKKSTQYSNYASAPMCYIYTLHVITLNLYIGHMCCICLTIYVIIIHLCQARDSLILIAVTLATYEHISILYVYTENIEHRACKGDKNDIM